MTQDISSIIANVKSMAQIRLVRYSNLDVAKCKQVFLFQDDHFCGVQFSLGEYKAKWLMNDAFVTFLQGNKILDRTPLHSQPISRAA